MTELPPEPAWWTAKQFAAQLQITARWLEDRCMPSWPADDRLPHHRVGRELRFAPEDREAIKARFARGSRAASPEPTAGLDTAKALAGLRKLDRLQSARH